MQLALGVATAREHNVVKLTVQKRIGKVTTIRFSLASD
jgi:hypothetical protein